MTRLSTMDEFTRKRWGKTRKIGKGRFVVFAGLLYSAVSIFFLALFIRIFDIETPAFLNSIMAAILIGYGPIWSYSFWTAMEDKWNQPRLPGESWWRGLL